MLRILGEGWSFTRDFLMISRANKKLKSSMHVMILYYFVMIGGFMLMWYSVFSEFTCMGRFEWLRTTLIVLFGLSMLLNVIVSFSDPGTILPDPSLNFIDLLEEFDCSSLCPICKIIKTPRGRHCEMCNKCVDRHDHHCPWVNNCVGRGNVKRFYAFISVQMCYLILC